MDKSNGSENRKEEEDKREKKFVGGDVGGLRRRRRERGENKNEAETDDNNDDNDGDPNKKLERPRGKRPPRKNFIVRFLQLLWTYITFLFSFSHRIFPTKKNDIFCYLAVFFGEKSIRSESFSSNLGRSRLRSRSQWAADGARTECARTPLRTKFGIRTFFAFRASPPAGYAVQTGRFDVVREGSQGSSEA